MNRYIQKLIKEQFNINDIDFSDNEQEYNANIFNKYIPDYQKIYKHILKTKTISNDTFDILNDSIAVAVVKPKDYIEL